MDMYGYCLEPPTFLRISLPPVTLLTHPLTTKKHQK